MREQQLAHIAHQTREHVADGGQIGPKRGAGQGADCGAVTGSDRWACPNSIPGLFEGHDELHAIPPKQRDPLAGDATGEGIGPYDFFEARELRCAGDERGQIEAVGLRDRPSRAAAALALTVRAIPADDDAGVD